MSKEISGKTEDMVLGIWIITVVIATIGIVIVIVIQEMSGEPPTLIRP